MSLDGLRAWIGEVERKLGMRTRVFLVLATIAIGGAGAAIYLAIDTRDNAVSESDVRELQERLEGQIGAGAASPVVPPTESVEPPESQPEPEPETEQKTQPKPESESKSGQGGDTTGGASGASTDNEDSASKGQAKLGELLEQAKEQNKKAEEAE